MQKMYRTTAFVATTSLALAACATTQNTEGAATPQSTCQIFSPIRWSEKDTRDTIRQVIGHNAAGRAVCGWQPAAPKPAAKPKAKTPMPKPKPKIIS